MKVTSNFLGKNIVSSVETQNNSASKQSQIIKLCDNIGDLNDNTEIICQINQLGKRNSFRSLVSIWQLPFTRAQIYAWVAVYACTNRNRTLPLNMKELQDFIIGFKDISQEYVNDIGQCQQFFNEITNPKISTIYGNETYNLQKIRAACQSKSTVVHVVQKRCEPLQNPTSQVGSISYPLFSSNNVTSPAAYITPPASSILDASSNNNLNDGELVSGNYSLSSEHAVEETKPIVQLIDPNSNNNQLGLAKADIKQTITLYDGGEAYKDIFDDISINIINKLVQKISLGTGWQKIKLYVNVDTGEYMFKFVSRPNKNISEKPDNWRENKISVFNINIFTFNDSYEISIDPNSQHYLLNNISWVKVLSTYGAEKKLKLALKLTINKLDHKFEIKPAMKYSKKTKDYLSYKTINFDGVSFANKEARKCFIDWAKSLGNTAIFDEIEKVYNSTLARKDKDPKPRNILFHAREKQVIQIDLNHNQSSVNVSLAQESILYYTREKFPFAYDVVRQRSHLLMTDAIIDNIDLYKLKQSLYYYSEVVVVVDNLHIIQNLDTSFIFNGADFNVTDNTTFIDSEGTVLRYYFGRSVSRDILVLVKNIIKIDAKILEIDSLVDCLKMIYFGVGKNTVMIKDIYCSRFLQDSTEACIKIRDIISHGDQFNLLENRKMIVPFLIPVPKYDELACDGESHARSRDGNLIALNLALTLYKEADISFDHPRVKDLITKNVL